MRSLCRSTLILLVTTLGPGCGDDKDPMVTTTATATATTPTSPSSDPGTGGENTTEITTGDDGPTTNDSTTANPTANPTTDPTNDPTVDPSTTSMTSLTGETTTTANPSDPTSDPTANPTTVDPTGDPTGDPDEAATQLCVDTINMYRGTLGLPPYQRWTDAEVCSDNAAQSDGESNTPHGAFGMCGEFAQNECPGWPAPPETMIEDCLAQMWAEGPGDDFNLHGHYINMSSQSYTQVACGFAIVNGEVWAVQNFK